MNMLYCLSVVVLTVHTVILSKVSRLFFNHHDPSCKDHDLSKHHAVGTKLNKVIRQCPQLIIVRISRVHGVTQSLCIFLSYTLPLPLQYRLWLHCLSLMKFITSQTLTAALPGLCTTIIQMGKGVNAVSARKILKMLSSVMKSCRNPTLTWITA